MASKVARATARTLSTKHTSAACDRGTVALGGDAGNVFSDAGAGQMLVDDQSNNRLDVIDPATLTITRRIDLPGCDHAHGLSIDTTQRLAFVACDGNAALLVLDLRSRHVTGHTTVGPDPDVLAYDPVAHRLYVAAESGWVTVLDLHGRHLTVIGQAHLADGAHVVAVDPVTHRSYYPIPRGPDGRPVLLIEDPLR